jgi:hypothetical protein
MLVFYTFLTIYGTAQAVSFLHALAINLQFVLFNCNTYSCQNMQKTQHALPVGKSKASKSYFNTAKYQQDGRKKIFKAV